MDFPKAWRIATSVKLEEHQEECTYRRTEGAFLCDCEVLNRHISKEERGLTDEQKQILRDGPSIRAQQSLLTDY